MFYVTVQFLYICNEKNTFCFLMYCSWSPLIVKKKKSWTGLSLANHSYKNPQINSPSSFPPWKKKSATTNLPCILHFTNVSLFSSLLVFLWQIFHSRQIPDLQSRMFLKETLLSDARIKSNKPYPASCWQLHFFPNAYFSLAWPSTIWQVCPVGKFIINSLQLEIQ